MTHENKNHEHHANNTMGVLIGTLIGGLAGAVTMLLLAPQSGKETRIQIQKKGIELRDRTSELIEDSMAQVRSSTQKITASGREAIKELAQQGQKLAVEQLDRVAEVVDAGKVAVQKS